MVSLHALIALTVAPLLGQDQPVSEAPPASEVRVELLASTIIPPEHPRFGRVGGLSGAAFPRSSMIILEGAPADTPPVRENGATPILFVSDDPNAPTRSVAEVFVRRDEGEYRCEIELYKQGTLETPPTDLEALATRSTFGPLSTRIETVEAFESPPTVTVTVGVEDPDGQTESTSTLALPEGFAERVRPNRGFESASFVGDTLWVATESALEGDGDEANEERGTRCVVLTADVDDDSTLGDDDDRLVESFFYETDPMPPHLGGGFAIHSLVEFCALPGGRVLALERSLTVPAGYGAKLYLLDGTTRDEDGVRLPILNKALVADIGSLARDAGLAWIGNLEAMALGPSIAELTSDDAEEGRLLLMIADDNFGADIQKTGSQALALRIAGAD